MPTEFACAYADETAIIAYENFWERVEVLMNKYLKQVSHWFNYFILFGNLELLKLSVKIKF